jgi:hypothetical protein
MIINEENNSSYFCPSSNMLQDISHRRNGLNLRGYRASVTDVFEMDPSLALGVLPWRRVDCLGTHSLFLGLNYVMNLKINNVHAPDGTLTPFIRMNCVYISYCAFRGTSVHYIHHWNLQLGQGELMGVVSFPRDGWGFPR